MQLRFPYGMHACAYSAFLNRLYKHPELVEELIIEWTQTLMHAIDKSLTKGSDRDNTIKVALGMTYTEDYLGIS